MRIAIMQPYLFPYIGYFQLIAAVDRFLILDDVAFIKKGWINRNRILMNGEPHLIQVPLVDASQNRRICDTKIVDGPWREKLLKSIRHTYGKAPCFDRWFPQIEAVVRADVTTVVGLATLSLQRVCEYLSITTPMTSTADRYSDPELSGAERILDICRREKADEYLNLPGGRELYEPSKFAAHNIQLSFLKPPDVSYRQFGNSFVPHLSIIDVLMFNPPEQARRLVQSTVVEPAEPHIAPNSGEGSL